MSEIKVGDRVRIVRGGCCYSTYHDFIIKHNIEDYIPYCLNEGDIGTVIKIAKHLSYTNNVVAIQNDEKGGVALYSEEGVEKVDEEVKTLKDKVVEVMPNVINYSYGGGVQGCPHDSMYSFLNAELDTNYCNEDMCEECWSRPFIEDTEEEEEEVMPKVTETKEDMVNNPQHYMNGKVACIDAIASATVNKKGIEAVCVANVIKYLWRYESKNGLEDVKKARWYLNKLIGNMEEESE